jgi:hypothetical protein
MYMCDRGVEFAFFYDYYIGFRNCSERVVFVFQFIGIKVLYFHLAIMTACF